MKQNADKVQFESRSELEEILTALEEYAEKHQGERMDAVKRMFEIVDAMQYMW